MTVDQLDKAIEDFGQAYPVKRADMRWRMAPHTFGRLARALTGELGLHEPVHDVRRCPTCRQPIESGYKPPNPTVLCGVQVEFIESTESSVWLTAGDVWPVKFVGRVE